MKKTKLLFLGLMSVGFFWANFVKAQVCPVCVVAVGAGLGFSRWFKIDDVVSSIWIGAFLMATVLWTLIWLKNKNWSFPYDDIIIFLSYYLLTFIPLYYAGIVGHPLNKIWGIDKIIFGSIIGTVAYILANEISIYVRKKNNGKVYFPYQRVFIPIVFLILTSVIFYALMTWQII
jgi:hypothetical protein